MEKERAGLVLDEVACDVANFAIVGEMAYLGGQRRTASVRARTECHVLVLNPEHLETVMARFPMLTRVICRQFALRLHRDPVLRERIASLLGLSLEEFDSAAPGHLRAANAFRGGFTDHGAAANVLEHGASRM